VSDSEASREIARSFGSIADIGRLTHVAAFVVATGERDRRDERRRARRADDRSPLHPLFERIRQDGVTRSARAWLSSG
jgi:hypothetical protein